nr:reverse transcriptase domain-containing protein [Tanacetum cinerariifolium]
MFTRSIVIQRRVKDLQLGVESYQKRLNLNKPDTYRSILKRMEAYTAYSNPRGFIYQNKDKKNRLIRIDKLHKFSDGTLNDVRTALDDRLKGIRMQYLPQTIWRKGYMRETSGCCKGPYDSSYVSPIFKEEKSEKLGRVLTEMEIILEHTQQGISSEVSRTVGENRALWSDKLEDALWAFYTTYKTSIGCTPYRLVYRKACHLPHEIEHKAYWALKHTNFDLRTASDHRKLQLNELSELRDQAYKNSLIYKERTKKLHDDKIKNRIFNVGDQVLLFNSRLKIFSGKLKSRWSGPFTIAKIYPYGTAKLIHPDGCNFKVNCHRLKQYHGDGNHRKVQINELNELRDQAYENSLIYKEKTKRLHYSKIKNRVFNIGDRVLLFNSRLNIFFGKLKSRWSGPFTISQVYPYGTVELSQPNGPNFKVNGHRIKHYFGGDIPKLVVPDLQTFAKDH